MPEIVFSSTTPESEDTDRTLLAKILQALNSGTAIVARFGYEGVSALKAETVISNNQVAAIFWAVTEGDGGQGWFRYVAASTATADDYNVLLPVSGTGRWIRYG